MGRVGGGVELTGSEASDVGNFRVCVMFAQTDERRRFDVSDEDNNLSGPCVEYQAAAPKKKKREKNLVSLAAQKSHLASPPKLGN